MFDSEQPCFEVGNSGKVKCAMTDLGDYDYLDDDEDTEEGDEADEQRMARYEAQQARHESQLKDWLLSQMDATEGDIVELFSANRFYPLTAEEDDDINKVEAAVGVTIKNRTWVGLDNSLVRTQKGLQCLHRV